MDLADAERHLRGTGLRLVDLWPKALSLVDRYEPEIQTVARELFWRGRLSGIEISTRSRRVEPGDQRSRLRHSPMTRPDDDYPPFWCCSHRLHPQRHHSPGTPRPRSRIHFQTIHLRCPADENSAGAGPGEAVIDIAQCAAPRFLPSRASMRWASSAWRYGLATKRSLPTSSMAARRTA